MCGIAGIIGNHESANQKKELVGNMLGIIRHRGPEASNTYTDGPVCLGHNRLKIIDLSDEANQPLQYQHITIAFNGEVYNYIELKVTLQKAGFVFTTQSDTEVVCAAYIQWGDDCVKHFIGMWSFALWDSNKQRLFCSRDRFGIKPFYYINNNNSLYFASELKALRSLPIGSKQINYQQLYRGLQMAWAGFGEETFYTQILQLKPAHNLVWQNGTIQYDNYWDVDFNCPKSNLSFNEKAETFNALFKESVQLHARSDVPNGMCLSGGLDSSAIAGMYCSVMPGIKLKTFSIYYDGAGGVDERPFIREVANKYPQIEPYYYTPTDADIQEHFHHAAYHADVPVFGSSYLSQYFLMKLALQEGVTVVLDGQGSDEYLGGYLHSFYRVIGELLRNGKVLQAISVLNALKQREQFGLHKTLNFLAKSIVSTVADEQQIYNLEMGKLSNMLLQKPASISIANKTDNRFDNFLYHLLMNTTLQTLLHFEDRNSMAFSLESRVPFLNHKLIEFAFTLLREDRINNKAETKYILREGLKPVLPHAVYARKDKKGFVTPGEIRWLNGPLKHLLQNIDYSVFEGMDQQRMKALVQSYQNGNTASANLVWRIAATSYWAKNFV